MRKPIQIKLKTIRLWERRGFFQNIHIHDEKKQWDQLESCLIKVLSVLETKKKLPKNELMIRAKMAESHRNMSRSFSARRDYAEVVDVDSLIQQVIV